MSDLTSHILNLSLHTSFHEIANTSLGTTDFSTTGGGVDVPQLAITVPPQRRPYRVRFGGFLYNDVVNVSSYLELFEDSTTKVARCGYTNPGAAAVMYARAQRRRPANRDPHTYQVRLFSQGGTNVHALGSAIGGTLFVQAVTL